MVITTVARSDFSGFAPNRATAILRIYDPVEDWANDAGELAAGGWGAVLPLAFWDVGRSGLSIGERVLLRVMGHDRQRCLHLGERLFGSDFPWRPFLAADAAEIRDFADSLAAKGIRSLLVVCGNGRARSWTIARWIACHLDVEMPQGRGWQRESETIAATLTRVAACKGRSPSGHGVLLAA